VTKRPLQKGSTGASETQNLPDLPPHSDKHAKTANLEPLFVRKMVYNFEIPEAMAQVRAEAGRPWSMGVMVGVMLYHISPLLATHLDETVEFQNKVPDALRGIKGFVPAIDQYIAYLRSLNGCSEKFPNDRDVARKDRKSRRTYTERYTLIVEAAYKNHIREALADIFNGWSREHTRLFNKGVDKGLTLVQWVVYPDKNVVFEAGEGDWAVWLRGRCEKLGMAEAKAGRKALEEM
jgi:hypothetical protein